MHTNGDHYKKAFENYLRTGTPIELSLKQAQTPSHYIWRTRRDGKVRSSHADNDGKVFSWDNPPPTGHPGVDYGCRCTAEPFSPDVREYLEISLTDVHDTGPEWSSLDFVNHYRTGKGAAVTLRETGHLEKVVARYMAEVEKRLKEQLAYAMRAKAGDPFYYDFGKPYDMTDEVFSLGKTTIGGECWGKSEIAGDLLKVEGKFEFYHMDAFTDPIDMGIELFSHKPYTISDNWRGTLQGQFLRDHTRSIY